MGRHTAIRAIDLLDWYDRHARTMPWRIGPAARAGGTVPDPYFVWLSEIMLQQTTVATVGDYFPRFTAAWPTVADLAAADLDQVLQAWAGLGYYARARNLHKCARIVSGELGGRFPDTEEALMALPGIGPYTAAVIAAIAFDRPATVVDGNVERVIARLRRIETPLPGAKPEIGAAAAALTPDLRPGTMPRRSWIWARRYVRRAIRPAHCVRGKRLCGPSRQRPSRPAAQGAEEIQAGPARCGVLAQSF